MISVIMASYLGAYQHAAKDRENKIRRAIDSVLNQTIKTELVVVADGCQGTVDIINKNYTGQLNGYLLPKQKKWSGNIRNTGIQKAGGDIICYLDIDDVLEKWHCEFVESRFLGNDWIWFDDIVYLKRRGWMQRKCNVNKRGFCGTSNIAHKKVEIWPVNGSYAHDWVAIQFLKKWSNKYKYTGHGGYKVMHVPGRYDM